MLAPHTVVCWGSDSTYSSGSDEQEEQVDKKKEIDRRRNVMAGVCQVFESQVLAVHRKILATKKWQIVINLVGHPAETCLSGALLI